MKGRGACARGVRRGGREELRVPRGVGRSVGMHTIKTVYMMKLSRSN